MIVEVLFYLFSVVVWAITAAAVVYIAPFFLSAFVFVASTILGVVPPDPVLEFLAHASDFMYGLENG